MYWKDIQGPHGPSPNWRTRSCGRSQWATIASFCSMRKSGSKSWPYTTPSENCPTDGSVHVSNASSNGLLTRSPPSSCAPPARGKASCSRLQPYDLAVLHHPHLGAVHLGHSAGFLGGGFHRLCDSIQKYFGISLLLRFAMGAE